MTKITRERFKIKHGVFDQFTNRTLFKLLSQGHFEGLIGPVSMGKEANVFAALKGSHKVIVKVYRLENADFNRMYEYIKGDIRFQKMRKSRRHVVFTWCRRESKNLLKAREAGVEAPVPIAFSNNVIVMSFIGGENAASKLKDSPPQNPNVFFREIIRNIEKLASIGFCHGDLSAFNILNYRERPIFIDFSHGTDIRNPRFEEFLKRDVKNILAYFKKIGFKADHQKILGRILKKAGIT